MDTPIAEVSGHRGAQPSAVRLSDSGGNGASGDLQLSTELLSYVAASEAAPRLIRVYRPKPTLAFSRRESYLPGFASALTAAASYGFTPVIRLTGGRAVPYDQSCLLIDVVEPVTRRHEGNQAAFEGAAQALAGALRALGVDAFVGEVAGEYCPGAYSVNARRKVKLVGISQRVIPGARLISAMIPVGDPGVLVEVLTAVNHELAFSWRPETFGSVAGEVAGVSFADVSVAIQDAFSPNGAEEMPYHQFASQYRALRLTPFCDGA